MHFLAALVFKKTFWNALRKLGGPGLILLGLVDNSVIWKIPLNRAGKPFQYCGKLRLPPSFSYVN